MTLLFERLWPALALAAGLGFLFAALGGPGRGLPAVGKALRIGALALLLGAAAASWAQVVPGAPGLWLDILLLLAGAYLAGVLVGAALRRLVRRPDDAFADDQDGASASREVLPGSGSDQDTPAVRPSASISPAG